MKKAILIGIGALILLISVLELTIDRPKQKAEDTTSNTTSYVSDDYEPDTTDEPIVAEESTADTRPNNSAPVSEYDTSSELDETPEVYDDSADDSLSSEKDDDIDLEVDSEMMLSILQENYSALADVEYNEDANSFDITPTKDDLILSISLLLAGESDTADWTTITDSFDDLSASLSEESDVPYTINLMNPVNSDKILYSVMDGVTIYDAME